MEGYILSRSRLLLRSTIKFVFSNKFNKSRLQSANEFYFNKTYSSKSSSIITPKGIKYRRIFYVTLPFATLFGYSQWRSFRKNQFATNFEIQCYCALPLRTFSRWWGWMADMNIPEFMRPAIYGLYSYTFNVNLEEAKIAEYKAYSTLSDFFCRELKENVRQIDYSSPLVSPCDGVVLNYGTAESGIVEQVKGVNYNLHQFLGDNKWCQKEDNGQFRPEKLLQNKKNKLYQCTIYLAPGDYHRFHSPADWQPVQRQHFSGELLSVNPEIASWIPDLFVLNERVSYSGYWEKGFFSMTAVGATNVGKIRVIFDDCLNTNIRNEKRCNCNQLTLDKKIQLKKGDLFGEFRMGSTIVLVFEAEPEFQFTIKMQQRVKMGERLGLIVKNNQLVLNNNIKQNVTEIRSR